MQRSALTAPHLDNIVPGRSQIGDHSIVTEFPVRTTLMMDVGG
jgi:hypothetical protein